MQPRSRSLLLAVLVSSTVLSATVALGQEPPPQPAAEVERDADIQAPAHVSVVDGAASLERDGRIDQSPQNVPLLTGDRLRTQEGRVEIIFGDGSVLDVDQFTLVDLQSDVLLRLLEGRVRLTVARGAPVQYRIDTPSGWVRVTEPGDYRISLVSPGGDRLDVELMVLRGSAELASESGATLVRAGERAVALNGATPSFAQPFNVAYWDAFERWVEDRRQSRLSVASSEYLPQELNSYGGTFDTYGTWQSDQTYGYVWYPNVAYGWRPYHKGRWDYYRPFGWTWIGYDPWAWPTHHYGRWGFSGRWFWIPTKHWGPAWVSWSHSPGFIGWCPRGWNGRPVFAINAHGAFPWHAWTVVPSRRFTHGVVVGQHAVGAAALPRSTTFITAAAAPVRGDRLGVAVPRGAPLHSIGRGRAVPRGTPLPGTVPSMPAVRSPGVNYDVRSGSGFDRDVAVPRRGQVGVAGTVDIPDANSVRRRRVQDLGVGGPAGEIRSAPVLDYTPRQAAPQAVPRGMPLPGTVQSMPAVPSPSDAGRGYYRHGAPPPQSAPAPSRMHSPPPSPPPASRPSDGGSGRATSRDGSSSGRTQAVPRSGGSQSGGSQSGGRQSGGSRHSGGSRRGGA
jgi:FecR protein